jgi:hypothetical protein
MGRQEMPEHHQEFTRVILVAATVGRVNVVAYHVAYLLGAVRFFQEVPSHRATHTSSTTWSRKTPITPTMKNSMRALPTRRGDIAGAERDQPGTFRTHRRRRVGISMTASLVAGAFRFAEKRNNRWDQQQRSSPDSGHSPAPVGTVKSAIRRHSANLYEVLVRQWSTGKLGELTANLE